MGVLANPKHERFAQLLAKGEKQGKAYVDAGYDPNDSAASRLAKNVKIVKRVGEIIAKAEERTIISKARVLQELGRIALVDPRKMYRQDGSMIPIHELDDDTAAALASIEMISRQVGGKKSKSTETTLKTRFWGKREALVDLGKHLGMFKEQMDVAIVVEHRVDDVDLAKMMAFALTKGAASVSADTVQ